MSHQLIGTKIGGRYEITRLLGEGGMAEVYAATQLVVNRHVAIKLMHRHLSNDSQFRARFEREAQAIAQLKHPHIIQFYDFDFDSSLRQYYMVIEYIDGPTLSDFMKATSSIPLRRSLQIIEDMAEALGYAHARQLQHRDIKPSNIMLDSNNRTILTDFGIAKIVQDTSQQLTASGAMVGTPAYISPEQASGIPGDHRSDIYSLGVVFYQLATGRLPYQGDTPIATILKHIKEIPPAPTSINPDLPLGVEAIILRCLAKEADDRYQNTAEMLAHLRDIGAAEADIDNIRTISGKVLGDDVFGTTPSRASRTANTYSSGEATYSLDPMMTITAPPPQRTMVFIGIGAVAIIALLTLGAFLFSTAGNSGEGPSAEGCLTILEEPLRGFRNASNESEVVILLSVGSEIMLIGEEGDYWEVQGPEDKTFWVEKSPLTLPPDCALAS
jgi:serine/threonine protein kinase